MAEIDLEALSTPEHGYTVDDEDDDDPVLLDREGNNGASGIRTTTRCRATNTSS